jgi:signal transduction histidine kinase
MQHLKKAVLIKESNRLARDLHDGLLQNLTGIALQLTAVHRLLGTDSGKARERIEGIQALLVEEQRRLRRLIERLKNSAPPSEAAEARWEACLLGLAKKIELERGLPVDLTMRSPATDLPAPCAEEIYLLVCEALTNSARHARATRAQAAITVEPDRIHIQIQDDGQGFAFRGRYDLAQLTRLGWGPQSLIGRITALHGQLLLESSCTGACLEITVPREEV